MVVTLLSALAAVTASPAISISAGISWQGQGKVKARQLHSSSELHGLNVRVSGSSRGRTGASDIDGGAVVLSDNKVRQSHTRKGRSHQQLTAIYSRPWSNR